MEEKLNETNVEAARVTKEGGFQMIKGEELEAIIKELDAWTVLNVLNVIFGIFENQWNY